MHKVNSIWLANLLKLSTAQPGLSGGPEPVRVLSRYVSVVRNACSLNSYETMTKSQMIESSRLLVLFSVHSVRWKQLMCELAACLACLVGRVRGWLLCFDVADGHGRSLSVTGCRFVVIEYV